MLESQPILKRYILSLIGPTLSLGVFVVTYYLDPLNFAQQVPLAAIPAVFLSIVTLLVSQFVITDFEVKRAADYSDIIYEAIKDNLHITRVGPPSKAIEYITSRMPSLREVSNTSFNMEDFTERADEKCYLTNEYQEFVRQIPFFAAQGLIWKDIGDTYSASKFRDLLTAYESLKDQTNRYYKYRLITHQEPQLNFAILEYKEGTREVLFNWDFRGIGEDPTVLVSRDKQVLHMFAVHFTHLWKSASDDHDNSATRSIARK